MTAWAVASPDGSFPESDKNSSALIPCRTFNRPKLQVKVLRVYFWFCELPLGIWGLGGFTFRLRSRRMKML